MKAILFSVFISTIHINLNAQDDVYQNNKRQSNKEVMFPRVNGQVQYDSVYNFNLVSKDDLFLRANIWVAKNYRSANDVIQLADKENGIIIVKGTFAVNWIVSFIFSEQYHSACFRHTMTIRIKDNKVKVEITDFKGSILCNANEVPIDEFRPNKWERRTNFPDLDKQVRKAINDFGAALLSNASEW